MRRITLLILLSFSVVGCAQNKHTTKPTVDTTKTKDVIIPVNTTPAIDTTKDILIDSLSFNNTVSSQSQVKIVFIKDENKDGWFIKYIFPLITLLLGAAIPLIWEHYANLRRLKSNGERWAAEVKFLEVPLKSQLEELDKFLVEFRKPNYEIPDFVIVEGLNGEKFSSMDKGELLNYLQKFKKFSREKATQEANILNGYINIIKSTNAALTEKFQEFLNRTSAFTTEFSRNLTRLSRAFGDYTVLMEEEYGSDEYMEDKDYQPLSELFYKQIFPYINNGGLTLDHVTTNFIPKLLPLFADMRHDERIADMSLYMSNCMEAITQINHEREYLNQNCEIIKNRYKEQLNDLKEMILIVELPNAKFKIKSV